MKSRLRKPGWATQREITCAVVQRIEIGPTSIAIIPRLPKEKTVRASDDYGDIGPSVKLPDSPKPYGASTCPGLPKL
jgi:hypothetical protein